MSPANRVRRCGDFVDGEGLFVAGAGAATIRLPEGDVAQALDAVGLAEQAPDLLVEL